MERTNGRRKTHRPSRFDRRLHRPGSEPAPDYIQHNPVIPSGRTAIPGLIAGLSKEFSYEPGMVVAEGNLVMVHGRYVGWGPKPMIAVDIFRVVNGKLVEHWDVMQEEVPASKTASGNPMFSPLRGGT
jgi:predicted SnoaL-like aldol condensation-catalyzing enzyme